MRDLLFARILVSIIGLTIQGMGLIAMIWVFGWLLTIALYTIGGLAVLLHYLVAHRVYYTNFDEDARVTREAIEAELRG